MSYFSRHGGYDGRKDFFMSNFFSTVGLSILPGILRIVAAAIEGYFNSLPGSEDGGEN